MAKHIVALFYGFSVFLGICNLILIAMMLYKNKNEKGQRLFLFLIAFFCYGFISLIIYYNQHIMDIPRVYIPMGLLQSTSYLGMIFLWVRYVLPDERPVWVNCLWKVYGVLCGIALILWLMDILFFLDDQFHVLNELGNRAGTILEGFILLLMILLLAVFLKGRKFPIYECLVSLTLIWYFSGVFVRDIQTSYFGATIEVLAKNTISMAPVFLTIINALTAAMLIPRIVKPLRQSRDQQKHQMEREVTIGELQEEFGISNREGDVLRLICQGMNNAQIAETLFISENTVKKHVNSIFRKMNVSSRPELISQIRIRETQ